ncbi:hypothetical protein FBULB1_7943 [Fusarium bulbicola]|nr:hypothetical protein FBULB1_7943 [Fusarium bulbicola]
MSDPLSVAGSAVGIISLGIQVCQGLISYLQSFKSQDQDIQDSLKDVQTVISILYSLKGILPKVDERSSGTPAIRRCLAESEENLREFQQFALKLRHTKIQIHTNVDDLGNAFKDQGANVAKLSDQLQVLDNSMAVYYQGLKSEISQAQLLAQEFRQEIGGQLALIKTDVGSLMSINERHQEGINQGLMKAFEELKEQNNFQNELIRTALIFRDRPADEKNRQGTTSIQALVSIFKIISHVYKESSPYDQDEDGKSHAMLTLETTLDITSRLLDEGIDELTLESLSTSAKGLIETLVSTAGDENGKVEHIFELPPIFRAIFQQSINMLETAIAESPKAATEIMYGLTTIELCVYWPEGLRKLLSTKAIDLLGEIALSIAVQADCVESVDLLFKAGCPLYFGNTTAYIFIRASERCMDAIASNLARRRLDLLSLAEQQKVISHDLVLSSDIPDYQASYLCSSLDNFGISIPPELRVPSSYSTIYHFYGTSVYHYPILFKNGFTNLLSHDLFGLLPTMTLSPFHEPYWICSHYEKRLDGIDWLESQRIMDQTPTDPFNLGLNIQATGWHYLSRYCAESYFCPKTRDFYPEKTKDVLGVPVLDNCRCWCIPSGMGCTPLTTALRSYVEGFNTPLPSVLCNFFHTAIRETGSSDTRIAGWCIEAVRFFTFEALEMTHTCCEFTLVNRPDISSETFNALMYCDPGRWQKIRSDEREQENAALLETLMEEFIAYMIGMESSPRSLEIFVNGYWRQRMSKLYAVDSNEIKHIKNCLVGTKTYVLPDRVRPLLRKGFKLIEPQNLKSDPTPVGETAIDRKVGLGDEYSELLPCKWCR